MAVPVKNKIVIRQRLTIQGLVQGVGFRPFVYRMAQKHQLSGWVRNSAFDGVIIEVEGEEAQLKAFVTNLKSEAPIMARVDNINSITKPCQGTTGFLIQPSKPKSSCRVAMMPDMAICSDCLSEIRDPENRRYGYPFTNCTQCGPRFSIMTGLPYDRPRTTMAAFVMCTDCQDEYDNPNDRRFHAQPNACSQCGPTLMLWDATGKEMCQKSDALYQAAQLIREGKILALKGLGGFQLIVDARDETAVQQLRKRKHRPKKPFAVMAPDLAMAKNLCLVSEQEAQWLQSPQAPIVLLESREDNTILSKAVAPDNPYVGIMLPTTPLHHLLMWELDFPVVATSGNLSDDPICIDNHEALEQLEGIADAFLVHNRSIANRVDDSVARQMAGRIMILRRARGFAPLPLTLEQPIKPTLAVGGHFKNTVALAFDHQVIVSPHIGDLDSVRTDLGHKALMDDLARYYQIQPEQVLCDQHRDYRSTRTALNLDLPLTRIQHHQAHGFAVMAEQKLTLPILAVTWDGTGYGLDGTIWGGEAFLITEQGIDRFASLTPFALPGGEAAIRDPRRIALACLQELGLEHPVQETFTNQERQTIETMINNNINCPKTSSLGRLFDGVSALLGLCYHQQFEGDAAMALEFEAMKAWEKDSSVYPVVWNLDTGLWRLDWRPMVAALVRDQNNGVAVPEMAARFHRSLIEAIGQVARKCGLQRVTLSGGCFQNRLLLEGSQKALSDKGFHVFWPQQFPPNDGGLALGQIWGKQYFELLEGKH